MLGNITKEIIGKRSSWSSFWHPWEELRNKLDRHLSKSEEPNSYADVPGGGMGSPHGAGSGMEGRNICEQVRHLFTETKSQLCACLKGKGVPICSAMSMAPRQTHLSLAPGITEGDSSEAEAWGEV